MPRKTRMYVPAISSHVVQRCNNRALVKLVVSIIQIKED